MATTKAGDWAKVFAEEMKQNQKLFDDAVKLGVQTFTKWGVFKLRLMAVLGLASFHVFTDEVYTNGWRTHLTRVEGYKTRDGRIYITHVEG